MEWHGRGARDVRINRVHRHRGSRKTLKVMRLYNYCAFRCCMIQSFSKSPARSRSYASLSQVIASVHSAKIVRGRRAAITPTSFSKHYEIQAQRSFASLQECGPTVYALSTAPGRAAIAIIRISGIACLNVRTQHLNGVFVC